MSPKTAAKIQEEWEWHARLAFRMWLAGCAIPWLPVVFVKLVGG